jgi:hypothetical protein
MKLLSKLMLLAVPVLVAACGGGGSNETCTGGADLNKTCTPNPSKAIAEGLWFGPVDSDTSLAAQTIVLENGQYYSIFTASGSYVWMIEGSMTASGGAFTDSATAGFSRSGGLRAGSLSGNFTAKTTLTATTSLYVEPETGAQSFNGTYNATYDTPIALADVARTWTSAANVTPISSITIGADGAVSGTSTGTLGTCAFSGSFKPRSTGKHILDGTLGFSGTTCPLANKSMSVESTVVNGQMTVVGVTAQRDQSFVMTAQ